MKGLFKVIFFFSHKHKVHPSFNNKEAATSGLRSILNDRIRRFLRSSYSAAGSDIKYVIYLNLMIFLFL